MNTYGYARVSTKGQDLTVQVEELESAGVQTIFQEKKSGKTMQREEMQKLLAILEPGDTVVVCKLDRFARTTKEALAVLEPLLEKGIVLKALNAGTFENTYMGKFLLRTLLSIAELERDTILDRVSAGKKKARENPKFKEGRPKLEITDYHQSVVAELAHKTPKEVCQTYGISQTTLFRWKKRVEENDALMGI